MGGWRSEDRGITKEKKRRKGRIEKGGGGRIGG